MSIVHRTWLDPNRNDTDTDGLATFKEPVMMKIYEWYHGNMSALVENMKGPGILFDMHGYNNEAVDWTIIGKYAKIFSANVHQNDNNDIN